MLSVKRVKYCRIVCVSAIAARLIARDTVMELTALLSVHLSSHLGNPVAYHADRLLQGVHILRIMIRNPYLAGIRIDVFNFFAPLRNLLLRSVGSLLQISF